MSQGTITKQAGVINGEGVRRPLLSGSTNGQGFRIYITMEIQACFASSSPKFEPFSCPLLSFADMSQIRSMRFVKELDLLIVVEGTMILKIYAAGSRKVGQIEPAIAMRKLVIDAKKRSTRLAASQRKKTAGGDGAGKAKGTMDTSTGHEVCQVC